MKNIFHRKYTKCGEKARPRPFYKKIEHISGSTAWNVKQSVVYQNLLNEGADHLL